MASRKKSFADMGGKKKSVMEDKEGDELKILSSKFKEKKERTKSSKKPNKKEEQMKQEAEKQKTKTELEEVMDR